MKKERILMLLDEGLTIEEVPMLTKINEIEALIRRVDFDINTKRRLRKGLEHIKKETINHVDVFSEMINTVLKSKEDEY